MLIDLAHVSEKVMNQVLDLSKAPVIFSHSSAYAVCPHKRNVPDDVLRKVVSEGGEGQGDSGLQNIQCLAKVFGPLEICDLLPHFRLQT